MHEGCRETFGQRKNTRATGKCIFTLSESRATPLSEKRYQFPARNTKRLKNGKLRRAILSAFKGKWQYIFLFSRLKEHLKPYIKLFYRFFISCLLLQIF
jgi:hypothetical protein